VRRQKERSNKQAMKMSESILFAKTYNYQNHDHVLGKTPQFIVVVRLSISLKFPRSLKCTVRPVELGIPTIMPNTSFSLQRQKLRSLFFGDESYRLHTPFLLSSIWDTVTSLIMHMLWASQTKTCKDHNLLTTASRMM